MYVCVCRAVTEERVREVIEAGADSIAAVTAACCAGDDCGSCHGQIGAMIEDERKRRRLPVVKAA